MGKSLGILRRPLSFPASVSHSLSPTDIVYNYSTPLSPPSLTHAEQVAAGFPGFPPVEVFKWSGAKN